MSRLMLVLGLAVISLIACACGAPPANTDPASVIQAFYEAINAEDVDAAMTFVADDAEFSTAHGDGTGIAQVRDLIQFLVDSNYQYELRDFMVEGETVTWTYDVSSSTRHFEDIAAEAVIKAGKITAFVDLV